MPRTSSRRPPLAYATGLFIALAVTLLFRYFGDGAPSDHRLEWRKVTAQVYVEGTSESPAQWVKLSFLPTLALDVGFLLLTVLVAIFLSTSLSLPFCLFLLAASTSLSVYLFDVFRIWYPLPGLLVGITLLYVLTVVQKLSRSEKLKWQLEEEAKIRQEFESLKNNFLGLFSHDLKTPLAKIKAITDRLRTTPGAPVDQRDLTEISRSAEELQKYINNIINLVKVESNQVRVQKRPTDLNVLLNDVCERVEPLAAEKKIRLESQLKPLFAVDVDPHLLTEVFLNILDNAIKYSPGDSTVEIQSWEEGSFIHVTVRNEGHGLPNSIRPNLWEKISEHRSGLQGSGIGLYLVKYFVELHGGHVTFESKPQRGTVVHVTIPLDGG